MRETESSTVPDIRSKNVLEKCDRTADFSFGSKNAKNKGKLRRCTARSTLRPTPPALQVTVQIAPLGPELGGYLPPSSSRDRRCHRRSPLVIRAAPTKQRRADRQSAARHGRSGPA
jgi:hypothetical protein